MTELRPAKIFMQPFLPGDAWLLHCAHNGSWSHFPEGSAPRILKLQRFMVWGQKILFKVLTLKYICMNMDQKPMQRALVWSVQCSQQGWTTGKLSKDTGRERREVAGGTASLFCVGLGLAMTPFLGSGLMSHPDAPFISRPAVDGGSLDYFSGQGVSLATLGPLILPTVSQSRFNSTFFFLHAE